MLPLLTIDSTSIYSCYAIMLIQLSTTRFTKIGFLYKLEYLQHYGTPVKTLIKTETFNL